MKQNQVRALIKIRGTKTIARYWDIENPDLVLRRDVRVHPSEEQAMAYYIQWKENKERKGFDPSSS